MFYKLFYFFFRYVKIDTLVFERMRRLLLQEVCKKTLFEYMALLFFAVFSPANSRVIFSLQYRTYRQIKTVIFPCSVEFAFHEKKAGLNLFCVICVSEVSTRWYKTIIFYLKKAMKMLQSTYYIYTYIVRKKEEGIIISSGGS